MSPSAKKLKTCNREDIVNHSQHSYRFIEIFNLFAALTALLICKECKGDFSFREESGNRGFGFKIVRTCLCGNRDIDSGPKINTGFEINRRIVFVMRLLGLDREGVNILAGWMDMGQCLSIDAYELIVRHIHTSASSVFDLVCKKAVKEEKEHNLKNAKPASDLKVSGDGTWKKKRIFFIIRCHGANCL